MPRWQMIFTFPNLVPPVPSPFEVDHLYLCAASDRRLEQLATNPGNASGLQIVKQFSSTFGEPYESGCLLMRDDAPDSVREEEALRAFRNVCAISSITRAWATSIAHPFGSGQTAARWSDFFWFGFHSPGRSGALITLDGPIRGMDDRLERFRGQSAPHIGLPTRFRVLVDRPLLRRLFIAWRTYYMRRRNRGRFRRLFRSLEVAFHAAYYPADGLTSINDVGSRLGLWVSAFEVLFHPGGRGGVNKEVVQQALQSVPFLSAESVAARYTVSYRKIRRSATLAEALYDDLYDARNRFFHGNPVNAVDLRYRRSRRYMDLMSIAPVLYNAALLAFLRGHVQNGPEDATLIASDGNVAAAFQKYLRLTEGISEIETALLAVRYRLDPHGHPRVPRRT